MAASSISLSSLTVSPLNRPQFLDYPHHPVQLCLLRTFPTLQAYRRTSSQVGFAVNGLIILSFLWVLKAFLEVICTLGSVVFVSILLIRGVWSGVLYLQEGRNRYMNGIDVDDQSAWNRSQPVT
ncbi:Protein SHORT HYPOCOTYL IN WHITE LIGHT 1 [Bienertia sinuspersici]